MLLTFNYCSYLSSRVKRYLFLLNLQIEKIVLFLLEQHGLLASTLSRLKEQYNAVYSSQMEEQLEYVS
ncbi:hypothetical protein PanWU01x14_124100, partial [Parasponia andersonii]